MYNSSLDVIRRILEGMPKARHQEPTIRQSKNGVYTIRPRVDMLDEDGEMIRDKTTIPLGPAGMSKREAISRKNEIMSAINQADYVIRAQIGFGLFIEQEYRPRHIRRLAASTKEKYGNHLKNHILPAFKNLMLCQITPKRLDTWMESKQGLALATRLDLRNIISSIFTQAQNWGMWRDRNPAMGIYCGKGGAVREKRKLTDDQTRRFLAALPWDLRVMCCTGLFCTLRVSEMLGLEERHLDFENGLICIEQRYYRGDLDRTKNRKNRKVPMGYLTDDLKRLCKGEPKRFVFQIETAPQWGKKSGLSRDDRDLNQHFLRPAAQELGFYHQGFGFHSLRREAVTSIGSVLGVGQAMVAAGQSKVDMTLLYTLQDRSAQEEAIKAHQVRILGDAKGIQ